MKRLSTGIGAVLALGAAASAQAAGTYFGVTAGQLRFDQVDASKAELPVIEVKVGKRFNEYVGLEVRYGAGLSDDDIQRAGVPVAIELDRYYGLYGLGLYPVSPDFSLYSVIGISRGEITATTAGLATPASDVDGSYGLGAEVRIGSASAVTLEWARLFDESGFEVATLTVGLNVRF